MSELLNKANEYERLNKNKVDEQRPLFHLTGGVGWINDPNGFSFYKDEITCSINIIHSIHISDLCSGGMQFLKIY